MTDLGLPEHKGEFPIKYLTVVKITQIIILQLFQGTLPFSIVQDLLDSNVTLTKCSEYYMREISYYTRLNSVCKELKAGIDHFKLQYIFK